MDQDRQVGLYHKFTVTRTDGRSEPGERHYLCKYFVLDLSHDRFATAAIRAYAEACEVDYPESAADLREWLELASEPPVPEWEEA